jgi:hypothetical protein
MILRCSAEPKRRYLAQSCYFDINFEPLWRKDKMHPKWQESSFRYRTAEKFAEITVSDNRFLLCPAGCVLRYNKWQESSFRYRTAEKFAEITVSDNRFLLCPAGCVLRYNKQGPCVPQKSPSQPNLAASLGAQPPIPRKERCVWGKMFVLPSV